MEGVRNKSEIRETLHAIVPSQKAITTPVVNIIVIFLLKLLVMEKSKTCPVSDYVKSSSTIFSISLAFCLACVAGSRARFFLCPLLPSACYAGYILFRGIDSRRD